MRYRIWVIIASVLFVIGLGAGVAISAATSSAANGSLSGDLSSLEELSKMLGPFQATTAIFIFLKNASVLVLSFIFSPILCLLPILAMAFNGMLLSFVSAIVVQEKSLGFLLYGVLPHGIIEIPALIMGEAAALSFGAAAIMAVFSRQKREQLPANLKQNLKYLVIALILLVPAAIIETYVTPLLLK